MSGTTSSPAYLHGNITVSKFSSVCLQAKQDNRRCNSHTCSPCSETPGYNQNVSLYPFVRLSKRVQNYPDTLLVNPSLRKCIWDFLTEIKQWVKINNTISSTITTNSGAPPPPGLRVHQHCSQCTQVTAGQLTALSARTISSNTLMIRPYSF